MVKADRASLLEVFKGKVKIRDYVESSFGYDLHQTLDEIRPDYEFNETYQGSVPQSIITFLESESYEDAVRKAISLGGDSDTMACIAGGIAQAYYKRIPEDIIWEVRQRLTPELLDIVDLFNDKYCSD